MSSIPPATSKTGPFAIFNLGNNKPVMLLDFIYTIEKILGKKAKMEFLPMQPGDVQSTYANVESLFKYIGFKPQTTIEEGIKAFVDKYLELKKSKVKS